MSPRDAVRVLAIGRFLLGLSLLLAPRRVGVLSIGPDADSGAVSVFSRALGARDALLGAMTLHTVGTPEVARRWVKTCGAMDAIDLTAALTAPGLPPSRRVLFGLLAGGSAAAHGLLAGPADAQAAAAG